MYAYVAIYIFYLISTMYATMDYIFVHSEPYTIVLELPV